MVCFVDGVEEVGGYDEDVDSAAMLGVAWGAGLGLGVAGTDGDAVVDGLDPGRCELQGVSGWFEGRRGGRGKVRTPGRKDQPIKERKADMVSDEASRCCVGRGGSSGGDCRFGCSSNLVERF